MKRLTLLLTIAALCSLGLATPVLAAVPGNDSYASRSIVGSMPFTDALDTSDATTDATDAEALIGCGAPAIDASVWYALTPEADGGILIDAAGSDYAVGIAVLSGEPGAFALHGCDAGSMVVSGTAGEALTILVFDFDGVGNGGNLELSIDAAPPAPVLELTIADHGTVNQRTGFATIRGTVTCSGGGEADQNVLEVHLVQWIGRVRILAFGASGFVCDGTTKSWVVTMLGDNGRLGGGKATISAFAMSCGAICGEAFVERAITLRR
jgi:hypothetical protein